GEPTSRILRAVLPSWGVCLVGFVAALQVAGLFDLASLTQRLLAGLLPPWLEARAADLVCIGVYGTVCALVMAVLSRIVLHADLRDVISVSPSRLREPLRRVLLLRNNTPQADSL
ncbi:MAG: hypothetical protein NTV94_11825, partial [Planctomycetota bacterium]|nr:hypothetical protein [Planctomycetota bacterium]